VAKSASKKPSSSSERNRSSKNGVPSRAASANARPPAKPAKSAKSIPVKAVKPAKPTPKGPEKPPAKPHAVANHRPAREAHSPRPAKPAPEPPAPVAVAEAVPTDGKPRKNQAGLGIRDLEHFRDLLLAKRREIVGDMSSMEREALRSSAGSNLSTLPIHMADMGTDNYEQEFTLGLVEKDPGNQRGPRENPERDLWRLRRHRQTHRPSQARSPTLGPFLHRIRPHPGTGRTGHLRFWILDC
jgi:DnaK suppressor protein